MFISSESSVDKENQPMGATETCQILKIFIIWLWLVADITRALIG